MFRVKNFDLYRKSYSLLFILILFIICRLLLLFGSINLFYQKELYVGTVAFELIRGSSIPIMEFQKAHYHGGKLFMGLFTIPFFAIFGIKGLSLKLAALCFSSLILLSYYVFINKFFGKKTAYLWGLFFIFSCPTFSRFNLINTGIHLESSLFIPLSFFFLYKILYKNAPKLPIGYYAAMGFSVGLGIWFLYTHLITLLTIFIFLYLYRAKTTIKSVISFFIGILIGLLPWFYYNLTHNFMGLFIKTSDQHSYSLVTIFQWINFKDIFLHIKNLFLFYLPGFYNFSESLPSISNILSYTHYFIFIISLSYLIFLERNNIARLIKGLISKDSKKQSCIQLSKNAPLLLFTILFTLLIAFSDLAENIDPRRGFLGYRYLLSLYTLQLLLICLFIQHLRNTTVKFIVSIFILASGIFGMSQDISLKNITEKNYKFYRPYSYERLGFCFAESTWSFNKYNTINLINKVSEPSRGYAYQGLGWETVSKLNSGEIKDLNIVNLIDPKYQKDFFIGLGRYSYHEAEYNKEKLKYFSGYVPQQHRPYFYYGLGQRKFLTFQDNILEWMQYPQKMQLSSEYWSDYYKGIGYAIGKSFGFNLELTKQLAKQAPKEFQADCYQGLRQALVKGIN